MCEITLYYILFIIGANGSLFVALNGGGVMLPLLVLMPFLAVIGWAYWYIHMREQ